MTQAQNTTETSARKFLEEIKTREFAPRSQVVIAWDGTGLVIEAPGRNGMREKIEGVSMTDLPGELQAVLIDQLIRLKAETKAAPKADRVDPEAMRREDNARIARERFEADKRWLDSLPADRREHELNKREEKRLAIIEAENIRARDLWRYTAKKHSIDLANTVITDPSRRPNQRIVVAVNKTGTKVTYNPRHDDEPKTKRGKKPTLPNIKLNLDLGI